MLTLRNMNFSPSSAFSTDSSTVSSLFASYGLSRVTSLRSVSVILLAAWPSAEFRILNTVSRLSFESSFDDSHTHQSPSSV